ncbi:hypothetical protein nbrc107696_02020 [Gordonia spumicola]|uniref:PHA accumulation regulator DNA-binding N-terminal domain-containing protein n=1 Tax=Gordonia spumicola TaxID=589161 RepID=A0A7I9V2X9_9ACTN|nr:polyhydroxyalkanoate synthesis regulator DNA-binding domain-containing protein [Gordonia spumicola]GED99755.1 hypothetical protein nbrc107696_02020 [Gordonia spumicola]
MADDEPYLIKRYSNRKLYDSVRRKFTTLDEVAKLLESGIRVLIRDHDTGVDRTDEVLAQVLRRRVKGAPGGVSLLSDLLRAPVDVAKTVVDATGLDTELRRAVGEPAAAEPPVEPASDEPDPAAVMERQAAEIRELRDQVSTLTQAVTMLIEHQTAAASPPPADD